MAARILILSDKNETRSPMLAGWLKYYCKNDALVKSAGIEAGKLNLIAAKAMMEAVIDITKHKPTDAESIKEEQFDWVISLTTDAEKFAEKFFKDSQIITLLIEHPFNHKDNDQEKLKKHRKTANELEEFCIEFVHKNIRKLI